MTRKDYKQFVDIISSVTDNGSFFYFMSKCADLFEKDNQNFDREKFIQACETKRGPMILGRNDY